MMQITQEMFRNLLMNYDYIHAHSHDLILMEESYINQLAKDKLLDGIKALLVSLFALDEAYLQNQFNQLREAFPLGSLPQQIINQLQSTTNPGANNLQDITINWHGQTVTIVSFEWLRRNLETVHTWVRGVFFVLLLFYNYNQVYKLIRSTSYGFHGNSGGTQYCCSKVFLNPCAAALWE